MSVSIDFITGIDEEVDIPDITSYNFTPHESKIFKRKVKLPTTS